MFSIERKYFVLQRQTPSSPLWMIKDYISEVNSETDTAAQGVQNQTLNVHNVKMSVSL